MDNELLLVLNENGSTGYIWQAKLLEGNVEINQKRIYPNQIGEKMAVGGNGKIEFSLKGSGKVHITLSRPWLEEIDQSIEISL